MIFLNFILNSLKSFRSLEVAKCFYCTLKTEDKKQQLRSAIAALKDNWAPSDEALKKKPWKTFESFLTNTFEEKGIYWQIATMQKVQEELIQ